MITYLLNIFNKLIVYYIRNLKNVYNTGKEIQFMQNILQAHPNTMLQ